MGRVDAADAYAAAAALDRVAIEQYLTETDIRGLYLIKAGRFDEAYFRRVSEFNWRRLFRLSPLLPTLLAERLAERFDYVLIDSRSGHTDTGGISTMLMPEKLVAVFTPNAQSIYGIISTMRSAIRRRLDSDDFRPLVVFPLPARVEVGERRLREEWRRQYQGLFERLFSKLYRLDGCDLTPYFDQVQILHFPVYSYGEEIAVLREDRRGMLSMSHSYEVFCDWLTEHRSPWD